MEHVKQNQRVGDISSARTIVSSSRIVASAHGQATMQKAVSSQEARKRRELARTSAGGVPTVRSYNFSRAQLGGNRNGYGEASISSITPTAIHSVT
jgi:hypothetical protein